MRYQKFSLLVFGALGALTISCAHQPEIAIDDFEYATEDQYANALSPTDTEKSDEALPTVDAESEFLTPIVGWEESEIASTESADAIGSDATLASLAPEAAMPETETAAEAPADAAQTPSYSEAEPDEEEPKAVVAMATPKPKPPVKRQASKKPARKIAKTQSFKKKSPKKVVAKRAIASNLEPVGTKAMDNQGLRLNRYYVVRMGDSPEYLSKLFYGDIKKADKLVRWNGGNSSWKPGTVVYYQSAFDPEDSRMTSFYKENEIRVDNYVVKEGDTLESVAKAFYGDERSAREIALVNSIRSESDIKKGDQLLLNPMPFPATRAEAMVAAADKKALVQDIMQEDVQTIALAPSKKDEKKPELASPKIGGFLAHNPLVVGCSIAVLFLILSYVFMQRRRYRSRIDF